MYTATLSFAALAQFYVMTFPQEQRVLDGVSSDPIFALAELVSINIWMYILYIMMQSCSSPRNIYMAFLFNKILNSFLQSFQFSGLLFWLHQESFLSISFNLHVWFGADFNYCQVIICKFHWQALRYSPLISSFDLWPCYWFGILNPKVNYFCLITFIL